MSKIKYKATKERLFGWGDEGGDGLRIVILENMFTNKDFDDESREYFFSILEQDIMNGLENMIGTVKKITIFWEHPDGIIKVKFSNSMEAENCVQKMNGWKYNGREIQCYYFDGKTNYNRVGLDENKIENIEKIEKIVEKLLDDDVIKE